MGKIILITGGARSGKSTFAEKRVKEHHGKIAYIATAIAFDEGMKSRIAEHINQRPSDWHTFEKPTNVHEIISEVTKEHQIILLDCMTVLLSNHLLEKADKIDDMLPNELMAMEKAIQNSVALLINAIEASEATFYMVTNEVGSGIVPENKLARIFRDIAGRANQHLAHHAEEVHLVVSGIPMRIK